MLQLTIPARELFDEATMEFIYTPSYVLHLEHSLLSVSKWESKWCKPFLVDKPKTEEETIDYIKCMTLDKNIKPEVYSLLTRENRRQVDEYIAAPMTATTISDRSNKGKGVKRKPEIVTSELIYYWMFAMNIPMDCEKWHLNRLLTLIRVCDIKNQNPKDNKRSRRELIRDNAALNEANRKRFKSKG